MFDDHEKKKGHKDFLPSFFHARLLFFILPTDYELASRLLVGR
jgi:hypothetical protein